MSLLVNVDPRKKGTTGASGKSLARDSMYIISPSALFVIYLYSSAASINK